jgi:serine phosphatase RsbU (regulator of sigma subunit)|tara:strand:- start:344 stop:574 length:231 start_codon:yes stop_codon:yes gene_type:complete
MLGIELFFVPMAFLNATNEVGDIYGFDRIRLLIESCCKQELSNRDLIDHLMADVDSFRNGQEQEDHQTVVVLHIVE